MAVCGAACPPALRGEPAKQPARQDYTQTSKQPSSQAETQAGTQTNKQAKNVTKQATQASKNKPGHNTKSNHADQPRSHTIKSKPPGQTSRPNKQAASKQPGSQHETDKQKRQTNEQPGRQTNTQSATLARDLHAGAVHEPGREQGNWRGLPQRPPARSSWTPQAPSAKPRARRRQAKQTTTRTSRRRSQAGSPTKRTPKKRAANMAVCLFVLYLVFARPVG